MPAFWENHNYIQSVRFVPPSPDAQRQYPFSIPAVRECGAFSLQSPVTIFTGENGSLEQQLAQVNGAQAESTSIEGAAVRFSQENGVITVTSEGPLPGTISVDGVYSPAE